MIGSAELFARRVHAGQIYEGHGDYAETHLRAVVQVLADFGYDGHPWADAGWLHDVIEDTPTTREDLERFFGWEVALLVWACTKEGTMKKERTFSIYNKIQFVPRAARVKLADRIANVEAAHGTRFLARYRADMPDFSNYIRPHASYAMWNRLVDAFESGPTKEPQP